MRVLLLCDRIPQDEAGGAAIIAWSLACGLRDSGHEVHVISATPGQPSEATLEGIATYHIHSSYPARFSEIVSVYNPQTAGPLKALFARIKPDVLNAHTIHHDLSFYSLIVAKQMGIPAVFNAHDVSTFAHGRLTHFIRRDHTQSPSQADYRLPPFYNLRRTRLRWNPLRVPLVRAILRDNTRVRVAVSQALRAALEANGMPPFRVVYNGIDVERFAHVKPAAVTALRDRLGLKERPLLLFVGRLRRDKGTLPLLKALDSLVKRIPNVALLILADRGLAQTSPIRSKFSALIAQHVVVSGWLRGDDLVAAYHLADILTVPSICLDSFPTVNLEAMAAGRPVVATCYGGSPEAVADGETGYIVNPFDTDMLAGRLEQVLANESLRRRMGEAGLRRAREMFSREHFVAGMLEIYREAIG